MQLPALALPPLRLLPLQLVDVCLAPRLEPGQGHVGGVPNQLVPGIRHIEQLRVERGQCLENTGELSRDTSLITQGAAYPRLYCCEDGQHGPAYLCHLADVRLQGQLPHQRLEQVTPLLARAARVLDEVAALRGGGVGWGGGGVGCVCVGGGPGALASAQRGSRSKQPMH